MSRFTEYDDGTRVYPKKGNPPIPPPGYQAAPGDPFKLLPIMPDCNQRETGSVRMNCGKIVQFQVCKLGYTVTVLECQKCIASGRQPAQNG